MRKNFGNEVGTGASAIKRDFQPETSVFDRTILIAKFLGPPKKKTIFYYGRSTSHLSLAFPAAFKKKMKEI